MHEEQPLYNANSIRTRLPTVYTGMLSPSVCED
jgi:hypothetical protein